MIWGQPPLAAGLLLLQPGGCRGAGPARAQQQNLSSHLLQETTCEVVCSSSTDSGSWVFVSMDANSSLQRSFWHFMHVSENRGWAGWLALPLLEWSKRAFCCWCRNTPDFPLCYFQKRDSFGSSVDPICPLYFLQVTCNFLYSVSFPYILLREIRKGGARSQFGHSCIINLPKPFKGESAVQEVRQGFSQSLSASLTLSETLQNLSLNRFPAITDWKKISSVRKRSGCSGVRESDKSLEQ